YMDSCLDETRGRRTLARRDQPSSRIRRTPIATAARSAGEMSAMRSWRRSLATARIWSVTATTSRPAQFTGTSRGGAGCGEVESGTTTIVRRRSLTMLVERIRHGRVLLISEPTMGSSRNPPDFTAPGHCPRVLRYRWIWRRIPVRSREYSHSDLPGHPHE